MILRKEIEENECEPDECESENNILEIKRMSLLSTK
jgi:hypothetical protein